MRLHEFITERKKKRKKKSKRSIRYGGYWYPEFAYASDSVEGGGDGGGGESIKENNDRNNTAEEVNKFLDWACTKLHIKNKPKIELSYDTEEAQSGHHTGRHIQGSDKLWVYANNRNLVDILRTVFHELVHWRQTELNMIGHGDSYPGSPIEGMADLLAGKYIKIYGKQHRNIFQ